MSHFITLNMIIDQKTSKKTTTARLVEDLPFLQWRVGHEVKPKGYGNNTAFTIKTIDSMGPEGVNPTMTYGSIVELESHGVEGETTTVKKLKGSTLQSGYAFVSHGVVPVEQPVEKETKPVAFNLDHVRNIYPRKDGRPGCRIMLVGANYAVVDSFEDIVAKLRGAGVHGGVH